MSASPQILDRRSRRLLIVEEHVRMENAHDLEGVLRTFGATARYDDEPWNEHYDGIGEVRRFYTQFMGAMPDLSIEILRQHFADEAVILEVVIRGTHLGAWKGLPATGRPLAIPLCGLYTFTPDDRLAGERIYYDRATVLKQLGVLHDPQSFLGRITTALLHPWTLTRALVRRSR